MHSGRPWPAQVLSILDRRLQVPGDISLRHLPSREPERGPAGRSWNCLRNNGMFGSYTLLWMTAALLEPGSWTPDRIRS